MKNAVVNSGLSNTPERNEYCTENAALKRKIRLLETVIKTTAAGYWQLRLKQNFEFVSPTFERMLGYQEGELPTDRKLLRGLVHPDDLPELLAAYHGHINSGGKTPLSHETRYMHKNGNFIWIAVNGEVVEWDHEGNPVEVVGSHINITRIREVKNAYNDQQKALQESARRFEQMYQKTPIMLHSIDNDGKLISVSDRWLTTLGYDREEVIGKKSTDFLAEESREKASGVIKDFFKNGHCHDIPYQMVRKNGEIIDVLLSAIADYDDQGKAFRSLAVITNVSEEVALSRRLTEQQDRIHDFYKAISQPTDSLDHKFKSVLKICCKAFNLDFGIISKIQDNDYHVIAVFDETTNLAPGEIFDLSNTYCAITLVQNNIVTIEEMKHSAFAGHPCYKHFNLETYIGIPLVVNGQVFGTINFSSPKPRRKKFSFSEKDFLRLVANWVQAAVEKEIFIQELSETKKRFQMAVDATRDGIWDWLDVNNDLEWWSPRFYELLGYGPAEIEPTLTNFRNLLHEDDHQATFAAVNAHFERNIPFDVEYRLKTKAHGYRWFRGKGILERDADQMPTRMIGSISDIHEKKLAEEALKKNNQDLRRSNRDLQQFAYIASHDLQEPLRIIGSFSELLARKFGGQLDDKAQRYIDHIVDGVSRMRELINSLLSYSRVGKDKLEFQALDCEALLQEVRIDLATAIEKSGAEIVCENLPLVRGIRPQLLQLFRNLISNAIKFCDDGQPRIEIKASLDNQKYLFSVRDNGIGFDPEFKDRIFEVFQRLHSRKQYDGTGIGLSICQRIVENHGGEIWAESSVGTGSTFFFTLNS